MCGEKNTQFIMLFMEEYLLHLFICFIILKKRELHLHNLSMCLH